MHQPSRRVASRVALSLFVAASGCGHGGGWRPVPPPASVPKSMSVADARLTPVADSLLARLQAARETLGAPALSAAVTYNGTLVWAGAVGWADLEHQVPATLATEFRLGSTSKAMTATALARLVDAKRIALDTGIARYLPTLPNRAWAPLTPRQLASHTAGIVDYATNRDLPGLWQSIRETRRYESATAALDVFDGSGLRYRPGSRFLYSSFDVNLLGAVMESVTGLPYPALMDSLVFAPTGAGSLHAQGAADSSAHAVFYEVRDGRWRAWRRVDHTYKWPSGGLVGTPSDVARVGGAWFDTTFIRPATAAELWTPQRLTDGRVNEQSYAVGWRVNRQPRLTIDGCPALQVHHGGVSKGSFSWLVLYPERRLAVSLMMNAHARTFREFASAELEITRLVLAMLEPRIDARDARQRPVR